MFSRILKAIRAVLSYRMAKEDWQQYEDVWGRSEGESWESGTGCSIRCFPGCPLSILQIFRPTSKREGWQAFLAILPRRVAQQSSGWLTYLYRQRVDGKWVYRYY